jgi:hypothetical protein
MEYTRETMPPVPQGKVRLCDYGAGYDPSFAATVTPIASAIAAVHFYPTATLAHETRGYVVAGACARWQEENWSVLYWLPDGTRHGRRFKSEDDARAYFTDLTDSQKVSARRQEDAMLEDTVYRPAREARAREIATQQEAKRERARLLRQRRKAMA